MKAANTLIDLGKAITQHTETDAHPQQHLPCLGIPQVDARAASEAVLSQLRRIIDPDFGEDIVSCGFVKSLNIDQNTGAVAFTLELTTPACPVKDQFKREATQYVQVCLCCCPGCTLGWMLD